MNYLELESVGKPVYREMVKVAINNKTSIAISVASYFFGVFLRKANARIDFHKPIFEVFPNMEKGFEEAERWKVRDHSPPVWK